MLGSPKTDNMYHAGWAWAGSTPYKSTKLVAAHFGGTRNRWPSRGRRRSSPTPRRARSSITSTTSCRRSTKSSASRRRSVVNGVPQDPIDGVSMAYTFADAKAQGAQADAVLRHHGQPRHLSRRLVRSALRPAHAVGARLAARHQRLDARQGHVGALQPRRRLVAGERSRREDAGQARRDEGAVPGRSPRRTRTCRSAAACGPWRSIPEHALATPYTDWTFAGNITRMPEFAAPKLGNSRTTSSPSTSRFRPTPTACSTRSAASPAGCRRYVKDGMLCYEYNLFEIQRTQIKPKEKLPTGKVKIEVETEAMPTPSPARPAERHAEGQRQRRRQGQGADLGTAASSPRTTASTSAPTSARRCRSTTSTRRRSNSTARSTR